MKKLFSLLLVIVLITITPITANADAQAGAKYREYIEQVSSDYGICPELIEAVIYYESGWDVNCRSSHGAIGLMQIIPKWNKERIKRLGVTDISDPYQNILVGVDILAEYAEKYEVYEALAAYNCGEYSKTFKRVRNGGSWEYSEKILLLSAELEAQRGK